VVVDELVASTSNMVAGANKAGYHLTGVNVGRDYTPTAVADIASAKVGDACLACGGMLRIENGIEVGNIFKLGTRYTWRARRNLRR